MNPLCAVDQGIIRAADLDTSWGHKTTAEDREVAFDTSCPIQGWALSARAVKLSLADTRGEGMGILEADLLAHQRCIRMAHKELPLRLRG